MPRAWLRRLLHAVTAPRGQLCATRRSAGVPFMIQALVTSEVQALGSSRCFHDCVTQLIQRCSTNLTKESIQQSTSEAEESRRIKEDVELCSETEEAEVWARCCNVLRALVRGAALQAAGAAHAQDALLAALHGFQRRSWTERNSATLLLSALVTRTFGVTRARGGEALALRNKMTGRIFFLRHPRLYDYMLEKLQEMSDSGNEQNIHPSLYPILLLLARLYPSSLEGTVSNLKLVAFVPHVLSCAKSSVLKTRQLAAKAMVPLISPEQYLTHIESMFTILHDMNIKRNYCHGILLQLIRLLDAKPDVSIDSAMVDRLARSVDGSVWVLEQGAGHTPCYVIVDEWVKVVNLLVWRFPTVLKEETIIRILTLLPILIFNDKIPHITSGREVCLANALYLYLIILTKLDKIDIICEEVLKALKHKSYDVVLAALNYLLIQHASLETENKFQEHLSEINHDKVLLKLKNNERYLKLLCEIMRTAKYLECKQKCLKVLTIEGDTQRAIVDIDSENDFSIDLIFGKLFECIDNSHENLTHIYLESLSQFVTKHLDQLNLALITEFVRTLFNHSTPDNKDENRSVVVGFLEKNATRLINLDLSGLSKENQFEYTATLFATLITTLEDDSDTLRQRTANTILSVLGMNSRLISSKCAEILTDYMERYEDSVALYVLVALLDFRSEVCLTDELNDECRVFDQNERYNIFLEETMWTNECAKKIIKMHNNGSKVIDNVLSIIDNPIYTSTYDKLCNNNIVLFKKMMEENEHKDDAINPKIRLFINMLS
ncbi:thyroid adenoma-associated protein homolog [Manduca sexta]|uniref:thyroid adenoma-associated protein homolog n=1 Tax=Manduca sexta TaxID=7130 RepID=UPI00188E8F41|nr:thyroid adenoma-associated protein homolog [Manduca sexta]